MSTKPEDFLMVSQDGSFYYRSKRKMYYLGACVISDGTMTMQGSTYSWKKHKESKYHLLPKEYLINE